MKTKHSRKNAYFGLHFDFHATDKNKGIGSKTVAENIGRFLDEVKPDYIQVDTKGHPGYSSYPTKVGVPAPGLAVDHLRILREETRKRGVLLIAHHSGLYDILACRQHPEWAVVSRDGEISKEYIDPLSEYAEKRLIPQLKELARDYGFDGAWIDGDNWACHESYRKETLEKFYKENGYSVVDEEFASPSRQAFRDFCGRELINYINRYTQAVKTEFPSFEITSNTLYDHRNPEKPLASIDFLSADLWSLDLRSVPRVYSAYGIPFDVMRWGMASCYVSPQTAFYPFATRHVDRLKRDAAFSISQGGGYQVVNCMTPQGEIRMYDLDRMKGLSEFLQERKALCYGSKPVNTIAVYLSHEDRKGRLDSGEELYSATPFDRCIFDIILDGGRSCGAILDYQMNTKGLSKFKTVVVHELTSVPKFAIKELEHFVYRGGNLILCGKGPCEAFSKLLDVEVYKYDGLLMYGSIGNDAAALENPIIFNNAQQLEVCDVMCEIMDKKAIASNVFATKKLGKGNVYLIGYDIFSSYLSTRHTVHRDIMRNMLDLADTEAIAYLESGIKRVDIVSAKKKNKLLVHVINNTEYYYDDKGFGYGEITPLCNIKIAIKVNACPKRVYALSDPNIEYDYDGEYIRITLAHLDIHDIIVIEE